MYRKFLLLIILALAALNTAAPAIAQEAQQTINLKQGFNFISFTLAPALDPAGLQKANSSLIEDIFLYSAAAGSFLSLSDGTLASISAGKGYIVKSKVEGAISISGTSVTAVADVSLKSGFNLIGVSVTVAAVSFSDLMKNYAVIKGLYKWSAAAGSFLQVLVDSGGMIQLIDGVDPQFKPGESYFINVSGDSAMSFAGGVISLTGGAPAVKVAAPVILPSGGTYTAAQSVTITTATSGADIHYTTDGSTPTAASVKYSGAISVSSSLTLKAIAVKSGMTDSDVSSAVYTISIVPPAGETITLDLGGGVSLEMVKIASGGKSFQMGSPDTEQDRYSNEGPQHSVTISSDFYIGKYEITQAQWRKVYGSWPGTAPSATYGLGDNYGAYHISWDDICKADGFLDKINALKPSGYSGFRLPTEAEWEYAARGATQTRFYWGDDPSYSTLDAYEWYSVNSGMKTNSVGQKLPNAFGLYDMSGNLYEWCSDWYGVYESSVLTDPAGPSSGSGKVLRGGNWGSQARRCRPANRISDSLTSRSAGNGFRLVLPAGQTPVEKAAAPVINPSGGTYTAAQSITITTATSGADIHYTTDGSTPTAASVKYSGAISVSSSLTLKAIAVKSGMTDSDVSSAVYTISIVPPAGETITLDLGGGVSLEMVKIASGGKSFQMQDYNNAASAHTVSFTKDYYIGKYEITQAQWLKIHGSWPGDAPSSTYGSGDNYPAYYISWNDICDSSAGFLKKINDLKPSGYSGFRLPTEAEWEYACRANTTTAYYWGETVNDDYLWHLDNSGNATHPAGGKLPNGFGLYDMSGNVAEWCSDWYGDYGSVAVTDPTGPETGTGRIHRGGSCGFGALTSNSRRDYGPSSRYYVVGFRLVLPADQTPVEKAAAPVITPSGGTYTAAQSVTITTATSGADIHYTTDGSTPTAASVKYSGAISVSSSLTLKAIAVKSGMTDSDVSSAVYTINLAQPAAGETITIDLGGGVTLEMIKITAGTFQMGSPDTEKDRGINEGPVHGVTLSRDYYIGKYEVTQAQWLKVNGSWPGTSVPTAAYGLGDNYPAYFISWNDICDSSAGFLKKINDLKPSGYSGFRLPTEAEWECAARGGTRTAFYWGDDSSYSSITNYAWYSGNSNSTEKPDGYVHPAGSAASANSANAFGLYDTAGNVAELCSDRWLRTYTDSMATDPAGPATGTSILLRGGSYINGAKYCRPAYRGYDFPSTRARALGFRLALSMAQ